MGWRKGRGRGGVLGLSFRELYGVELEEKGVVDVRGGLGDFDSQS